MTQVGECQDAAAEGASDRPTHPPTHRSPARVRVTTSSPQCVCGGGLVQSADLWQNVVGVNVGPEALPVQSPASV